MKLRALAFKQLPDDTYEIKVFRNADRARGYEANFLLFLCSGSQLEEMREQKEIYLPCLYRLKGSWRTIEGIEEIKHLKISKVQI